MVRMWKGSKHCRWCGELYEANKPHDRDGFCSNAHKMAHARAYKKYVTANLRRTDIAGSKRVTQKKQKKRK